MSLGQRLWIPLLAGVAVVAVLLDFSRWWLGLILCAIALLYVGLHIWPGWLRQPRAGVDAAVVAVAAVGEAEDGFDVSGAESVALPGSEGARAPGGAGQDPPPPPVTDGAVTPAVTDGAVTEPALPAGGAGEPTPPAGGAAKPAAPGRKPLGLRLQVTTYQDGLPTARRNVRVQLVRRGRR